MLIESKYTSPAAATVAQALAAKPNGEAERDRRVEADAPLRAARAARRRRTARRRRAAPAG